MSEYDLIDNVDYDSLDTPDPASMRRTAFVFAVLNSPLRWFQAWCVTRCARPFVWGLPAVMLFVGLLIVRIESQHAERSLLIGRYQKAAAVAVENDDMKQLRLCLERVVQLEPLDFGAQFSLGRLLISEDEYARGRSLIAQAAPEDRQGDPDAHLWVARQLFELANPLTPQLANRLRHHLRQATNSTTAGGEAQGLLGVLMSRLGDYSGALPHLQIAASHSVQWALPLAQLLNHLGKEDESAAVMEEALIELKAAALRDTTSIRNRLNWALGNVVLGRFDEAEQILKAGMRLQPDPRYVQRLADVYVVHYDALQEGDETDSWQGVELLHAALELMPQHHGVLNRLGRISASDPAVRQHLRERLVRMADEGKVNGIVHFMLGVLAIQAEDYSKAKSYFQLVEKSGTQSYELLNNLAWAMAHSETPDLESALQLANAAVSRAPNDGRALDTRGQILAKLGRWDEAIADLEQALPSVANPNSVRKTLVKAYSQLGLDELAARHQRLLE